VHLCDSKVLSDLSPKFLALKIPRIPPALMLFFLSPVIGELLSGSSPPAEFFTVFGFTIMSILYGGGAVVARELKIRWKKGVGSLLLIGASYGVIEEGLMVASFQNPDWMDLRVLGVFGRWFGVNWVWAVELTIYHAIVSITLPVLLVELVYPEEKSRSWLKGVWRKIVPTLFVADVIIGFFLFTQFTGFFPPMPQYLLFLVLSGLFLFLAYKFPGDWARNGNKAMRKPRYYFFLSLFGSMTSGFVFGVLPEQLGFTNAPILVIFLGLAIIIGILNSLVSYEWVQATPLHYHRLLFGSLFIFILFSFFQEMDPNRLDNTTGMSLVGITFLIGFLILGRKLK
jgi:hypothetical protein